MPAIVMSPALIRLTSKKRRGDDGRLLNLRRASLGIMPYLFADSAHIKFPSFWLSSLRTAAFAIR
jgi:hypothetical protein